MGVSMMCVSMRHNAPESLPLTSKTSATVLLHIFATSNITIWEFFLPRISTFDLTMCTIWSLWYDYIVCTSVWMLSDVQSPEQLIMKSTFVYPSGAAVCRPLSPAIRRQRQVDLWLCRPAWSTYSILGWLGLHKSNPVMKKTKSKTIKIC